MRLGIDTGGTYSDAVLYDDRRGVLASAKALTTKQDLSIGIGKAMAKVLEASPSDEAIDLVCISTTLATNAVVEGHGTPAALILIGYDEKSLDRSGLGSALGSGPVAFIEGGHDPLGEPLAPLDRDALERWVEEQKGKVESFAVAGYFAVRNPAHERAAREIIRELTDLPVTCAHELSSKLDAPRRALTALLNARLIPQIHHLINAVRDVMTAKSISSPLMVVKGDGSLIRDSVALTCPVETILSGPAASVVGVQALSGEPDLIVSDIGGTTTDIAVLRDRRPMLSGEGALVGGWRTMVEAIAVHTHGLGGDSEIALAEEKWPRGPGLTVGPRRVVPLSLLAQEHPHTLDVLRAQAARSEIGEWDGRFLMRLRSFDRDNASSMEARLWDQLEDGPVALEEILTNFAWIRPLGRLIDRGVLIYAAFSPSDAAHVLGKQEGWSLEAAQLGAKLLARRGLARGFLPELDEAGLAALAFDRVVVLSGRAIVDATLREEGELALDSKERTAGRDLVDRALGAHNALGGHSLLRPMMHLAVPLAGAGAPAESYYPVLAERMGTRLVLSEHAGVCNAVGAVAGSVEQRVQVLVTSPEDGRYRVHSPDGVSDFPSLSPAKEMARELARKQAFNQALVAGALDPEVVLKEEEKSADTPQGDYFFVELEVSATAIGRPRLV